MYDKERDKVVDDDDDGMKKKILKNVIYSTRRQTISFRLFL